MTESGNCSCKALLFPFSTDAAILIIKVNILIFIFKKEIKPDLML